ncbi:MAG: hypothetical protein JNK23_23395 [Opitutaceae bacterium]|nr:hypothetical protein [Opitutaceae bacterium]
MKSRMKMSREGRTIICAMLGFLAVCGATDGNEPAKGDNIVVFEDSFERSELGDPWRIIIPSFSIKDGRLVGHEVPERKHTTISRVPLAFRNAVFEFSFRLTDGESLHLVLNDETCEKAHAGHICRVSFSASQVRISDDRDGAFRKDLYQAFLASGRKGERLLLGESFPQALDAKRWYRARVALNDDQMEVLIDGKRIGSFRSPGISHPTKSDFGFVTKGNIVEIDDVRVTKPKSDQPPTRPAP